VNAIALAGVQLGADLDSQLTQIPARFAVQWPESA
jgi:hypothetical protein